MKVKDIIKTACEMIDKKEILKSNVFGGIYPLPADMQADFDQMLVSLNLANNLIAAEYYPLKKVVRAKGYGGQVWFEEIIPEKINRIVSVKNKFGEKVVYKTFYDHIKTVTGEVDITYTYLPEKVGLNDEIKDYKIFMSERIFAYGLLMEYCFMKSLYDDALVWENRLKNSLFIGLGKKTGITLPKRRWS